MRLLAPVPLLLAVVLLALGSLVAMWRGDEAELPLPDAAVEASAEGDDLGLADGSLVASSVAPDPDAEMLPTDRDVVDDDDEVPQDGEPEVGPLVTVVARGEGGKWTPVGGVEVAWIDREAGRHEVDRLPPPRQVRDCELPFRFGQRARTGSDGTLRLPPGSIPRFVAAQHEGAFAFAGQRRATDPVRLELRPDETLTVVVVQKGDRRATAAPVALVQQRDPNSNEIFWRGETERDGKVVLRHFQVLRPQWREKERFFAAVATPLQQQVATEFQGRPVQTEPVRLELPSTRPLSVRVVHHRGEPLLARLGIAFAPTRRPKENLLFRVGNFDRRSAEKPLGADPLVLAHVGCGVELVPQIQLPNEDGPRNLAPFRVPDDDSAPLDVLLRLPDDVRVVALLAADADGSPLGSASLPWHLARPLGNGFRGDLDTLPDGRGDFVVPRDGPLHLPPSADPLTLLLRETLDRDTVLGAARPLGALLRGERRDLGTVVLAPLPVLVHGRAVDDLGVPRAGQTVKVELAPLAGQNSWSEFANVRGPVGEDGAFAVLAQAPPRPFRVVLGEDDRHFAARSDVLSPGAYVELVQTRAGRLGGQVVPPPGLPENALTATLLRDDAPAVVERRERPRTVPVRRGNTRFHFDKLLPGNYTLTLTMRGLGAPLLTIPGLAIGPGDNRDPRLAPADVSSSLFHFQLRAVQTNGLELADLDGPVLWRHKDAGGGDTFTAFRWQKGKSEFWLPVPYADLVVVGPGIPATEVAVPFGIRDVLLNPITPFPVVLPGVRALAGPERAIRVSAVFVGTTGLPEGIGGQDQRRGEGFQFARNQTGKSGGGWLDGADRTGLVVSRPGTYQLTLRLYASAAREGRQAAIELGSHAVVVDGTAMQPLVLSVDTNALLRALATLEPPSGQPPSRQPPTRQDRRR